MMATQRVKGGYVWKQEIVRGRVALKRARQALDRLREHYSAATVNDILLALLEISETYTELEKTGDTDDNPKTDCTTS